MTERDFCYWLQGFFELNPKNFLTLDQVKNIREHLQLVFDHKVQKLDLVTDFKVVSPDKEFVLAFDDPPKSWILLDEGIARESFFTKQVYFS